MIAPNEKARPLATGERAGSNEQGDSTRPDSESKLGCCARCRTRVHGRNFGAIQSGRPGLVWCRQCAAEVGPGTRTLGEDWP